MNKEVKMNRILPVVQKELKSAFNSPIAYIAVVFYLVIPSVWFFYIQRFVDADVATLRGYFDIIPIIFIILLPALTMRSWAEEKKLGTSELLLTLPFRIGELVAGKFIAAFTLLLIMVGLTIPLPLTVMPLGDFEAGQIIGQYLGVLLLGAAGIAVGLFVSAVSTNQISAFIFTAVFLLFITLINFVNMVAELPGWLADFLNYLSLNYHFESFRKGLFDSRDLAYFLLVTAGFLYFNTKVIVFRKWN